MSRPSENLSSGDNRIEDALRSSADAFPGVLPSGGTLDAIVGRGRRARTVGRAARLGVATTMMAGVAFAAPGILRPANETPTVLDHIEDEEVGGDEVVDAAPSITVLSPRDGTTVTTPKVAFSGEVDPGVEVKVGPWDVEVAPDGQWRIELEIDPGPTTFTFWATDASGNRGFDQVTVTYQTETTPVVEKSEVAEEPAEEPKQDAPVVVPVKKEPAPAPKPEPKPAPKEPVATSHAFTANQKYGSCSEPVPYDEFWGTAKPGTQVWVWSEYGEKTVTVNNSGEWFARVEFPNAPQGVPFDVKNKSLHTGDKTYFSFVNEGSGGEVAEKAFTADMEKNNVEYDPPYGYWSGTATPGTTIWVGSPYGEAQTKADNSGHWRTKVWFETAPYGTHTWTVVVESSNDDRATFEYTGTRPEPATTFSADMEKNNVEHEPPYGYWSGTAAPGATIHVVSEYGSAETVTGDDGHWRTKVWFNDAPYGTHTWQVVVESSKGDRATFEFTGTRPESEPEPEPVDFTSDQIYDVTDDEPPHSLYAGTATAGDKIHIFNEYGEGYAYASESGHWELWVEFPGAPRGQSMTVNVKHWQTGETHTYTLEVV